MISDFAKSKTIRIVCYCDDCQAFPHYLGRAQDVLDASGGTDICPAYPSQLRFTQGVEHLKCLRLTPKGLLRWYADFCKTPIGNCPPSFKVPYVGLIHSIMNHAADGTTHDAALGPVVACIQGRYGIRPLPPGAHEGTPLNAMAKAAKFIFRGWIKGWHQPSPFFDESGQARVRPYILTADERESLRKFCGPR
jgi:hypothetical protein